MRVLSVDIGTNSTLHLIAEIEGSEIYVIDTGIAGNNLGAGLDQNDMISDELLEYNRCIISDLLEKAKEHHCVSFGGVGTHALRKAKNSREFIGMCSGIGMPVKIITDDYEAKLAWRGVFSDSHFLAKTGLLDLGGGSTELSWGSSEFPSWSQSIACGAVSISREFFRHDPPLAKEVQQARAMVDLLFTPWHKIIKNEFRLVGIAGTISSLAALTHGVEEYKPGNIEGLSLQKSEVAGWEKRLFQMTLCERRRMKGMPEARAESIHAGAMILNVLLHKMDIDVLTVSDRGLLYGLAIELAESDNETDI